LLGKIAWYFRNSQGKYKEKAFLRVKNKKMGLFVESFRIDRGEKRNLTRVKKP